MKTFIYRESSNTTGNLAEAAAKATARFAPMKADRIGYDEEGNEYAYVSLTQINRATRPALAAEGLWLHTAYTIVGDAEYCVVTLSHKSDEWMSSVMRIPPVVGIHQHKAACTLTRRLLTEGMLGIAAEGDEDNDAQGVDAGESASKQRLWQDNDRLARRKIESARSVDELHVIEGKISAKVLAGDMAPDACDTFEPVLAARAAELEPALACSAPTTEDSSND